MMLPGRHGTTERHALETDRGLRPDRKHGFRGARRTRRLTRLAVPAAFRFRGVLRCPPRRPEHGRWRIAPEDDRCRVSRRYLPGTAVLETRFENESGAVTLTDFMPITEDEGKVDVVRIVHGLRGEMAVAMELVLRFNYGQAVPWVRRRDYGLSAIAGPDAVELHTLVPLVGKDLKTF